MNLDEALSPDHAYQADQWAKEGNYPKFHQQISGHVMKGEHTIIIPLHEGEEAQPHPAVEQHLAAHGYKISDYRAGYAVEPKANRIVRIGKALNHTGAPEHIVKAFNNDPNRTVKDDANVEVAITNHPHHVAGMSTGRGWTSCLNMATGSNRHYIPEEIKNGTHAAYLIHKGDHDIERPIARIALKNFVSNKVSPEAHRHIPGHDNGGYHHVLVPETSSYGAGDGGMSTRFEETVQRFTDRHFPMLEDRVYQRDGDTHDDGLGNQIAPVTEKMMLDHLNRGNNPLYAADPKGLRRHHVEFALEHLRSLPDSNHDRDRLRAAILHSAEGDHLSAATVNREFMYEKSKGNLGAVKTMPRTEDPLTVIAHRRGLLHKLSTDHTRELLAHFAGMKDSNAHVAVHNLVNSPKVDQETRDRLTVRPDGKANLHLMSDPDHVSPKIANAFMETIKPLKEMDIPLAGVTAFNKHGTILHALSSPHFTTEHLNEMASMVHDNIDAGPIRRNPNYTRETHEKILDSLSKIVGKAKDDYAKDKLNRDTMSFLGDSHHTTPEDIEKTMALSPNGHKSWPLFLHNAPNPQVLDHAIEKTTAEAYEPAGFLNKWEMYRTAKHAIHHIATNYDWGYKNLDNIHADQEVATKVALHDARSHDIPGSTVSKDEQITRAGKAAHHVISTAHWPGEHFDHVVGQLLDKGMNMRAATAIRRKYALGHGVNDDHLNRIREVNPAFHPGHY
jgi:hypothetical protein